QLHYDVECPSIKGYASPYPHFCQSTRVRDIRPASFGLESLLTDKTIDMQLLSSASFVTGQYPKIGEASIADKIVLLVLTEKRSL
ncbi:hypothetical protein, partial [Chroococcidiopsis cubana]